MGKNNEKLIDSKIRFITSMLIFGSVGIFVAKINRPSLEIAFFRSLIGSFVIGLIYLFKREKLDIIAIRKNWKPLLFSSMALGFNWIFLFEAYKNTTISSATLAYYMSPVILILLAAMIYRIRITSFRALTIVFCILGLMLILFGSTGFDRSGVKMVGIFYGLLAAFLYAIVVLTNRSMKNIGNLDRTLVELLSSCIILGGFSIFRGEFSNEWMRGGALVYMIILGVVHTGFAYFIYFSSLDKLDTQYVALFSYLDPITAVFLSFLVFGENMNFYMIVGALLILGSSFLFEAIGKKENRVGL
ncbi:MAG: DMT family transporter [Clostridiaceae bacterium]